VSELRYHPIEVALRHPVRGVSRRPAVLVEGERGWGEWSPVPGYPMDAAVARRAAEEIAQHGYPKPIRNAIPVNGLVDGAVTDAVIERLRSYQCVKVKVGDAGDIDRVAALRDRLGPTVALRLDANGQWDVDTALERMHSLARYDIEFIEQPVPHLDDLARVRRRSDVPIAADECIRSRDDVEAARKLDAMDVFVVKVQTCGGITAALQWAELADVPVVVSSMLETSVGLRAGLALAAALPELPYACGLGTGDLLANDVVHETFVATDGVITLRPLELDQQRIADVALSSLPVEFLVQDEIS
jgi:O-succinylbenzoate synthase